MKDHSTIKNYRELTGAIKSLEAEISAKESSLAGKYGYAKTFYTPSNIAILILKDLTSSIDWVEMALKTVRKLKTILESKQS